MRLLELDDLPGPDRAIAEHESGGLAIGAGEALDFVQPVPGARAFVDERRRGERVRADIVQTDILDILAARDPSGKHTAWPIAA